MGKRNVHRVSQSHERCAISVVPTGTDRSSLNIAQEHGLLDWSGDCRSPLIKHYSQLNSHVLDDDILAKVRVSLPSKRHVHAAGGTLRTLGH